jgi:hypothetical protein
MLESVLFSLKANKSQHHEKINTKAHVERLFAKEKIDAAIVVISPNIPTSNTS